MHPFDPTRLRQLRKAQQVTAAALARELRLSPAQIHRLENGQRRLTVDHLLAYCSALGLSISSVLQSTAVVPITGTIDSEFQIEPLVCGASNTLSPPLAPDMSSIAALRWAASSRFQPMRDHIVFYQRAVERKAATKRHADNAISWNVRALVTRRDGSQCLGWPIKDDHKAHIDFGNGPVEFSVDIVRAEPVVAVMPPFALANLQPNQTQELC